MKHEERVFDMASQLGLLKNSSQSIKTKCENTVPLFTWKLFISGWILMILNSNEGFIVFEVLETID